MKSSVVFLSILGALGAGAAIGVFGTKTYFEEKYKRIADEEIESVKAEFKVVSKAEKEAKEEELEPEEDISKEIMEYNTQIRDYSIFSEKVDKAELQRPSEDDSPGIYLINIDDYDDRTLGYEKKELHYFVEDETLTDENDEPVDRTDPDGEILTGTDMVGRDILEEFDRSLESVCYVRNEMLMEDYEISKIFGSYGDLFGDDI